MLNTCTNKKSKEDSKPKNNDKNKKENKDNSQKSKKENNKDEKINNDSIDNQEYNKKASKEIISKMDENDDY